MARGRTGQGSGDSFKVVYQYIQPDIYTIAKIADLLEVDIRDLLIPTKKS